MMKKRLIMILSFVLVAALSAGIGVYAATTAGSQSDPLITLSYLTDSLQPGMMSEVETEVDSAAKKLEEAFDKALADAESISADTYKVVSLSSGQTLKGDVGCEIMLREGTAAALGSLSDSSGGTSLSSGSALTANHMYLVLSSGDGASASSAVTLLVRGTYSIS